MKHLSTFKNIFKKKKDEEPDYEVKGEDKSFKFQVGEYVKIKEESLNDVFVGMDANAIFKIIKKSDFGFGKMYRRYYGLIDIKTNIAVASKYEEHLEFVPEYEVYAKKYNI